MHVYHMCAARQDGAARHDGQVFRSCTPTPTLPGLHFPSLGGLVSLSSLSAGGPAQKGQLLCHLGWWLLVVGC